jgi:hypothetical protein
VRWHCVRKLFKLGAKYFVTQIGALGIYQNQPMIITQFLGPAKVMAFVVAQKIITLPMDLVYMATVPFDRKLNRSESPAFTEKPTLEPLRMQDWEYPC